LNNYHSIVIGGGHNGLVCAAYLAKSGQKVLILEANSQIGGLVANREFHPGFRAAPAHTIGHFPAEIAKDLGLDCFAPGASRPLATFGLRANDAPIRLRDGALTGTSKDDADAYAALMRLLEKHARALRPSWFRTMPRIGVGSFGDMMTFAQIGMRLRLLGKEDLHEFLRIASLPARDLMDEYFDDVVLKAMLSWDGLIGAKIAPRSPNSAVLTMLYRLSEGSSGAHRVPDGGVQRLVDALATAAAGLGAEVRTSAPVERILIDAGEEGLKTTGVRLRDGEEIQADRVISSVDPQRTFFGMVGIENLDIGFTNRIRRLRCEGYVAKLHLALDGLPQFGGLEQPDGRLIIAPNMDAIEFSFDAAKYGECPSEPVMEVVVPSVHDSALAPEGKHVLSAHVMYVPYHLTGGWTDDVREGMKERAVATLADYSDGLRSQIIASEFLTPADLEREYHVTGGHWHHTEFAMDQLLMMRPTYGAAQYRTPIAGLHLCGAGCHPGGDLTGAPGHNAAQEILR
jgi:phytoene dehydrogenase-like protein